MKEILEKQCSLEEKAESLLQYVASQKLSEEDWLTLKRSLDMKLRLTINRITTAPQQQPVGWSAINPKP